MVIVTPTGDKKILIKSCLRMPAVAMSFVDLATLALHRRNEMEIRISTFSSKCDIAINDIRKLKSKARAFVEQLNCEPAELKGRFLTCMKQLDEYIYLITDFNLAISKLEENGSMDMAPVQDNAYISYPVMTPTNLLDVLSEPAPSTSSVCQNMCPVQKMRRRRIPKEEQLLIAFSSSSCSAESVPEGRNTVEKEVQCVVEMTENLNVKDSPTEAVNLPAQSTLQTDQMYTVCVMAFDGPTLWLVEGDCSDLISLVGNMDSFYKENKLSMSMEEIKDLSCCVYFDKETLCHYRALFLEISTEKEVKVFLVDTGEFRSGGVDCILPLDPRFCDDPPYVRCCHLADVELLSNDKDFAANYDEFMKGYLGKQFTMRVDDNTSESLGVYIFLDNNTTLNELLVQEGLAVALDKPRAVGARAERPPAAGEAPEYTDAVEAVAGYSNRDEIDICKHYKGGPEKTCFKGARCQKRHVLKHPDGWTLDRVAIPKCRSLPLPAPGTWQRVQVTYVCHFDRVCVQLLRDEVKEELPSFGVVLPPTTLEGLARDMNSPAARVAYKKLDLAPAPGELVAALYPPDDQWYRARVTSSLRADQSVQVTYIDFGNEMWVKEDAIRALEPRFLALPAQAVRCRLAGVAPRGAASKQWAAAKAALAKLTLDRALDAHVIARDLDEITVEIYDAQGYSIAELLEAQGFVTLEPYEVDDSKQTFRVTPA